jgi:hypothetical protein
MPWLNEKYLVLYVITVDHEDDLLGVPRSVEIEPDAYPFDPLAYLLH